MSETGSIEKYIIEKWEIMEPVGTHLSCTKKNSSMEKKIGVKRKAIKKRSRKGKKKKKHTLEPVHCHSDRFFLSHHPIIFIRNAFDLLGCFFNICSHLHPGGRFYIERSTRPEKAFYRVSVSIPALGRQPGTSWNNGVSDAQSPAHFALCFYLSILSSALCIQPDLVSLFFGLVLLFHLS